MRAVTYSRFGPPEVLEVTDIPKPTPRDYDILIKVHATTASVGDWRARSRTVPRGFGLMGRLFFGFSKPRQPILGSQLSGEVEAVGKAVRGFKVGDHVFAFTGTRLGCYVEYKCMPEDGAVALKPANLSFEEAAAISYGGTTALSFLRRANVQKGNKVLINGASGAVGSAAVQLAKHFGGEVTGVCSTANLGLVRSIGADKVVEYATDDFTRNGETYDVIVDTAGTAPFSRSKGSLKVKGHLLLVAATLPDMLEAAWASMTTGKKVIAGPTKGSQEDLRFLAHLAESGQFKPVIDRRYSLEQIVEAHRYVDAGKRRGNVVITVS